MGQGTPLVDTGKNASIVTAPLAISDRTRAIESLTVGRTRRRPSARALWPPSDLATTIRRGRGRR